jgi:hypothetical protein
MESIVILIISISGLEIKSDFGPFLFVHEKSHSSRNCSEEGLEGLVTMMA